MDQEVYLHDKYFIFILRQIFLLPCQTFFFRILGFVHFWNIFDSKRPYAIFQNVSQPLKIMKLVINYLYFLLRYCFTNKSQFDIKYKSEIEKRWFQKLLDTFVKYSDFNFRDSNLQIVTHKIHFIN